MPVNADFSTCKLQLTKPYVDGAYYNSLRPTILTTGVVGHGLPLRWRASGFSFGGKSVNTPAIWENYSTFTVNAPLHVSDSSWEQFGGHGGALATNINPQYAGHKSAYNDWSRHEFATSFKKYPMSDKVYASFKVRVNCTAGHDYGVIKHTRLSSQNGAGGGAYNGTGVHAVSDHNPQNGAGAQVYNPSTSSPAGMITIPFNEWVLMEYETKLSTPDTPDGYFKVTAKNGATSQTITNYIDRTSAAM